MERFTARLTAIGPDDLPARIDFPVLVACKQLHTEAVAALLAGRLAGDAFVAALQNGLPSAALAAAAGPGRVVQACVNFGADVTAPGVVLRGNRGTFKIGEIDGTPSARVDALVADIADAEATTQVMGYVWGKEAYGAMLFATAVSDLAIHEAFDDPAYHPLLLAVAREVLAQALARPLPLDGFDPDDLEGSLARLADFNRRSAKSHSGMRPHKSRGPQKCSFTIVATSCSDHCSFAVRESGPVPHHSRAPSESLWRATSHGSRLPRGRHRPSRRTHNQGRRTALRPRPSGNGGSTRSFQARSGRRRSGTGRRPPRPRGPRARPPRSTAVRARPRASPPAVNRSSPRALHHPRLAVALRHHEINSRNRRRGFDRPVDHLIVMLLVERVDHR